MAGVITAVWTGGAQMVDGTGMLAGRSSRRAVVGFVVGALLLVGCSTSPGEAQMLSGVTSLTFPGATEAERYFDDAANGRTVDGAAVDRPAELRIYYRVSAPVDIDAIRQWYHQRLASEGWTTDDFDGSETHLVMSLMRPGLRDRVIVETYGAPDKFVVRYQIHEA